MRRFEKLTDGARKFWQVKRRGKTAWRHWGRVGTDGQRDRKDFVGSQEAAKAVTQWTKAKLRYDVTDLRGA